MLPILSIIIIILLLLYVIVSNYKDIRVSLGQCFTPLRSDEQSMLDSIKKSDIVRKVKLQHTQTASVIVDLIDIIRGAGIEIVGIITEKKTEKVD